MVRATWWPNIESAIYSWRWQTSRSYGTTAYVESWTICDDTSSSKYVFTSHACDIYASREQYLCCLAARPFDFILPAWQLCSIESRSDPDSHSNMQRIQICSDLHIEKHTWGTVVRLTGPRLTCPTRWVHPRENLNKRTPELERPRRREEDEKNQCSLFLQPANCYFLTISPSIKLWPGIIHSVLLIYGFMHAYFYVSSVIHHSSLHRLHNKHLVCDGAPGSERWKTTWLLSSLLAGESCISNQTERACGGNLSCDLLQVWGRPWSGGM